MDMNDFREIGSMGITESMERLLSTLDYRILAQVNKLICLGNFHGPLKVRKVPSGQESMSEC